MEIENLIPVRTRDELRNWLSPRSKKSSWTELNKERVRRLERLGLMRDEGRRVLPDGMIMDAVENNT